MDTQHAQKEYERLKQGIDRIAQMVRELEEVKANPMMLWDVASEGFLAEAKRELAARRYSLDEFLKHHGKYLSPIHQRFDETWYQYIMETFETSNATKIQRAEHHTVSYVLPVFARISDMTAEAPPSFNLERQELELTHHMASDGVTLWLGYAPEIDTLYWMSD